MAYLTSREQSFVVSAGRLFSRFSLEQELIDAGIDIRDLPELSPPEPHVDIHLYSLTQRDDISIAIKQIPTIVDEAANLNAEGSNSPPIQSDVKTAPPPEAILVHQATQFTIQLDPDASPIHLGKPNRKVIPDINLATFKHSEVVSRIHADILCQNNQFFIRDSGSANGTFVNNQRIPSGNPYALSPGDRISLGKGDLVTFTFELS